MTIESLLTVNNLRTVPSRIINILEDTSDSSLYRSALKVQMDLYLGEILRYLSSHQVWSLANAVLDLGCGPGDLISHLSRHYPDKFYRGVDINDSFIKAARKQTTKQSNCEFICADLYDFAIGRYDVVILRAVLQHLIDSDRFMKHLPRLLENNSVVIFNDTPNENFVNSSPAIPTFDKFYNQLEVSQREAGGNRDCLADLKGNLEGYNFAIVDFCDQAIPIKTDKNRLLMIQYLILGCSVAKQMFSIRVDLASLFDDLVKWYGSSNPYMQIKTKWMMIRML